MSSISFGDSTALLSETLQYFFRRHYSISFGDSIAFLQAFYGWNSGYSNTVNTLQRI